jgi:hypothetical protein
MRGVIFVLIILLVFSVGVFAIGSSTGARTDDETVYCEDDPYADCVCEIGERRVKPCEADEGEGCNAIVTYECVTDDSTTSCVRDEKSYNIGDRVPSEDSCNTCTCGEGGSISCTKKLCRARDEFRKIKASADRVRDETADGVQRRIDRVAELRDAFSDVNCEELEDRKERIRCRLARGEDYRAPDGNIPEACKNLKTRGQCIALYATVDGCYQLEDGAKKDRCFKRAVGLRKASLGEESPEGRPEKARKYAVSLLYDLQEKIEYAAEEGRIDPDDAAEIVDKIVEIKRSILEEETTKTEVKAELRVLRQMWKDARIMEDENE